MNRSQFALVVVVAVLYSLFIYSMGVHHGLKQKEKAVEIAFDAAAQQYKNGIPNDSSRFDHYGNEISKKGASPYVLPKNARTESNLLKTPKTKKSTRLRKRY